MTDFEQLIRRLAAARVDFILVGGAAAIAHGSSRLTQDLDIVYSRSVENLDRIISSLSELRPYLRGAPPNLPFQWDRNTLEQGLNFTLTTQLGDLDLLGEIVGGGSYGDLLPFSDDLAVFGTRVKCLNLDRLIEVKRAAGRPKDLEAIAELEALREERKK